MGAVEVGVWVAFSFDRYPRLVGQVVQVFENRGQGPREVRVWCSELEKVVPVKQGAIIEEVQCARLRPRRISADGS